MAHDNGSKFANPGPAGLMVLAFYLGCLWPVATHQAPHEQGMVLIALGFAGAITQIVCGVIALHKGEVLNGNILCAFSAFMWLGCIEWLGKALEFIPHNTMVVDGWVFLIMGIFMVFFTHPHLAAPKVAFWFMIFTDMFFVPAGLFFLTKIKIFWVIAGWDLPFVVISIIWLVSGVVLNTFWGKQIIPLGKPYRPLEG
jgi:succinate-acetate transporter protein